MMRSCLIVCLALFVCTCDSAAPLYCPGPLDDAPDPGGPVGAAMQTVLVTNADELRAAATRTDAESLNILIDRRIDLDGGVYFPNSDAVVRLIGVTPDAGIYFNMVFDGNWDNPDFRAENGLEFHSRQVVIRGLWFAGYEWRGAVIKGHARELLDISKCEFRDIGTIQFPHRVPNPTSNDAIINQCVAAHSMNEGHISIVDCTFQRCVLNNRAWSHCLYMSARSILITRNRFVECGNPFAIGGVLTAAVNNIFDNVVEDPQPVEDRFGVVRPTYLATLGAPDYTAFLFNEISGAYFRPWNGSVDALHNLVDYNDYSGMTFTGVWASDTVVALEYSVATWNNAGFDAHSSGPIIP